MHVPQQRSRFRGSVSHRGELTCQTCFVQARTGANFLTLNMSFVVSSNFASLLLRTYDYFIDIVLPGYKNDGEMFDNNRENGYVSVENDEVLAQYLVDNEDAIAYLGYSANLEVFAVPIQNSAGDFVEPTATSVEDGSYNPLSRSLYMNLRKCFERR